MKQLTVKELIEELLKLNQDMTVMGEGCDCHNPVIGVSFYPDIYSDSVLIEVQT